MNPDEQNSTEKWNPEIHAVFGKPLDKKLVYRTHTVMKACATSENEDIEFYFYFGKKNSIKIIYEHKMLKPNSQSIKND